MSVINSSFGGGGGINLTGSIKSYKILGDSVKKGDFLTPYVSITKISEYTGSEDRTAGTSSMRDIFWIDDTHFIHFGIGYATIYSIDTSTGNIDEINPPTLLTNYSSIDITHTVRLGTNRYFYLFGENNGSTYLRAKIISVSSNTQGGYEISVGTETMIYSSYISNACMVELSYTLLLIAYVVLNSDTYDVVSIGVSGNEIQRINSVYDDTLKSITPYSIGIVRGSNDSAYLLYSRYHYINDYSPMYIACLRKIVSGNEGQTLQLSDLIENDISADFSYPFLQSIGEGKFIMTGVFNEITGNGRFYAYALYSKIYQNSNLGSLDSYSNIVQHIAYDSFQDKATIKGGGSATKDGVAVIALGDTIYAGIIKSYSFIMTECLSPLMSNSGRCPYVTPVPGDNDLFIVCDKLNTMGGYDYTAKYAVIEAPLKVSKAKTGDVIYAVANANGNSGDVIDVIVM